MKNQNRQFYLVDFQILSEAIKKTIQTKELLKEGEAETINEAVKKTGISRSAYYKYKDHVAPALDMQDLSLIHIYIVSSAHSSHIGIPAQNCCRMNLR